MFVNGGCRGITYAGSMDAIIPPVEATNSLFMNSPVGCVHETPLGAVNSSESLSVIVRSFVDGGGKGNAMMRKLQEREAYEGRLSTF